MNNLGTAADRRMTRGATTRRESVGSAEREHYRTHGYAIIRDAVPEAVFKLAWEAIDPWVERVIGDWLAKGIIDHDFAKLDRWNRLREAWNAAGRPHFRRQPFRNLMTAPMYDLMKTPELCGIAAALLGTGDISIHGIFNARAQLPSEDPLHTVGLHQDGQLWHFDYDGLEPDLERRTHVMTMWIPLRDVDEQTGCLRVVSTRDTGNVMFESYEYDVERTGVVGLAPADIARLAPVAVPMRRGDVLVFTQRTVHGASPVGEGALRWSIDLRYEATAGRTHIGKKFGFVVASETDPSSVTPLEKWLSQRQR